MKIKIGTLEISQNQNNLQTVAGENHKGEIVIVGNEYGIMYPNDFNKINAPNIRWVIARLFNLVLVE